MDPARHHDHHLRNPSSQRSDRAAIRLGMPHLAHLGLSEVWLLKELGHRHWCLLGDAAGLQWPEFRDREGAAVYPAFCAVLVEAARLDHAAENENLVISSELARVSATQFASRHRLACRGADVGAVTLLSVFVKREQTDNRRLARIAVQTRPMPLRPDFTGVAATASIMRAGVWKRHFGFSADPVRPIGRARFRPCPSLDFNGAGFLYFPSFVGFADRAEWEVLGTHDFVTSARDVFYYGNLDIGEHVAVDLMAVRESGDELDHWCRINAGDGRRLADVFTRRRYVGSLPRGS